MKKIVFAVLGCFLFISCQDKVVEQKAVSVKDSKDSLKNAKFQMYEMSEMASLMEQMFAYNTQLKERVLKNEDLGTYPLFFEKLHTASFTDPSDNDVFFQEH
ncbi:MAG TPA: hypothetical protein VLY87_03660, partial [Flavobacterium sp.]|nr:hypothetical protein [Flavobacterium sp.]